MQLQQLAPYVPAGYTLAALPPPGVQLQLQQQWLWAQWLAAQEAAAAQQAAAGMEAMAALLAQPLPEVLVGPGGEYQPYCEQVRKWCGVLLCCCCCLLLQPAPITVRGLLTE